MNPGRNAPCPCGSGKKYKKCCQEKLEVRPPLQSLMQQTGIAAFKYPAIAKAPTQIELGQLVALFNTGRHGELEGRARALLELYPNSGAIWKLLCVTLQSQGKDVSASLRRATELLPGDAEMHNYLGNNLKDLRKLNSAVASYRRALEIKPDYAEAHNNLGIALKTLGRHEDAVASYRHALEIKPDYAEAHNNLGVALQALGQTNSAVASYRRALEIKPDNAEAHNNLGVVLKKLGRDDEAIMSYRRALEIKPSLARIHFNLGIALQSTGQFNDALACYQKAYELGLSGAKVCAALMLPPIMGTRQEVLESRAVFEQNVNQLLEEQVQLDNPLSEVAFLNFYLAYHGSNDRDLQVKIARYYEQACPSLLYVAPHCTKQRHADKTKIRIGFLSKYDYDHSVSRCFSRVIDELVKTQSDLLEVTFIATNNQKNPDGSEYASCFSSVAGRRINLPLSLAHARERVAALELDILIYLDIGMEPLSYFLAFSRLARVQCVLGGHPVTTGIGNMDYFLSTDLTEPPDADAHYSEKLVRLPTGVFYFERPTLPDTFKTRTELGMPEGRRIYLCPMKLQKIHPDFDEAITRILQIDDNGVVILFEDARNCFWKTMLVKRFEKTIPGEVRERVLFLPWIKDYEDFVSANAAADVVLDPFHFGIGSTIIATFAVGTPIVTKPGEFLRGRVGMGFCKMIDVPECIAESTEEYAQLAVKIATDRSFREGIRAKILENSHLLYDNPQPVDDFVDFLCTLTERGYA